MESSYFRKAGVESKSHEKNQENNQKPEPLNNKKS